MKYKTILTGIAVFLLLFSAACENPFLKTYRPDNEKKPKDKRVVISSIDISVTAPAIYQAPDNAANYADSENYFDLGAVSWKLPAGADVTGNFTRDIKYTAEVILTAQEGYRFPDDAEVITAKINSQTAVISVIDDTMVTISREFDALTENAISSVSIIITAPLPQHEPVTTVDALPDNSHFSASAVTWKSPAGNVAGNFVRDISYIAEITLTAENNYYFPSNLTASINSHTALVSENTERTVKISFTFDDLIEVDYNFDIEFDPIIDQLTSWNPGNDIIDNTITIPRSFETAPTTLIIMLTGSTYKNVEWIINPYLENQSDNNNESFKYTFDDNFRRTETYTLTLMVWTDTVPSVPYSRTIIIKVVADEN